MFTTPCNSGYSCRQCLSILRSVWVTLQNQSQCCYQSPADVDDDWLIMTSNVTDCPYKADGYQAMAIGIVFGILCLVALLGVIWACWSGIFYRPCCCGERAEPQGERMDDEDSSDSGRSSVTLSTTTDDEG